VAQLGGSAVADPPELDITDSPSQQYALRCSRNVNHGASEAANNGSVGAPWTHNYGHRGAGASGQCFLYSSGRPPHGALAIDAQDHIAGSECATRAAGAELRSQANVHLGARHLPLILPVTVSREELGIGIPQ
jgi:hypothetical protein